MIHAEVIGSVLPIIPRDLTIENKSNKRHFHDMSVSYVQETKYCKSSLFHDHNNNIMLLVI
ncbi:hypothetical protein Hanom_Chr07g00607851 [Helianthus anomalus]